MSDELRLILALMDAAMSAEIDMMWERGSEGNAMQRDPEHEAFSDEVKRGHAYLLSRGFVVHHDSRGNFKHYCTKTWCPDLCPDGPLGLHQ